MLFHGDSSHQRVWSESRGAVADTERPRGSLCNKRYLIRLAQKNPASSGSRSPVKSTMIPMPGDVVHMPRNSFPPVPQVEADTAFLAEFAKSDESVRPECSRRDVAAVRHPPPDLASVRRRGIVAPHQVLPLAGASSHRATADRNGVLHPERELARVSHRASADMVRRIEHHDVIRTNQVSDSRRVEWCYLRRGRSGAGRCRRALCRQRPSNKQRDNNDE